MNFIFFFFIDFATNVNLDLGLKPAKYERIHNSQFNETYSFMIPFTFWLNVHRIADTYSWHSWVWAKWAYMMCLPSSSKLSQSAQLSQLWSTLTEMHHGFWCFESIVNQLPKRISVTHDKKRHSFMFNIECSIQKSFSAPPPSSSCFDKDIDCQNCI